VPAAALVELGQPGVVAPVVESRPKLVYPPQALEQGWEARIGLKVLVDEAGEVADAQIVSDAAGTPGFAGAAVAYVKTWTFRPATKDGVPVKAWLRVDVDFRLPR
jgi:protein TonB